jgi:heterodisulfide reductase subunit A-like polyferredoxin
MSEEPCGRCGWWQCVCPVTCPEPFTLGDGKRFHWRIYNPGTGQRYQVYSIGLEHWAECLTPEHAEAVATALELLYGPKPPS